MDIYLFGGEIFIKNNADFNENLASFIGDTASYYFLANKYGKSSKQYIQYLHEDQDYRTYSRHILRGTKSLDSLYQSFTPTDSFDSLVSGLRNPVCPVREGVGLSH